MVDIEYLFDNTRDVGETINHLKEKTIDIEEWSALLQDYEPTLHRIMNDHTSREDRPRSNGGIDKASRITVGLEKLLVNRITEFMFSIPVKRIYHNADDETKQEIVKTIEMIYKRARVNTENIKRFREYFAACEIVSIWYTVPIKNREYGFESKQKLRVNTYSPMAGYKLYPLFDEYNDMVAMSVEYERKDVKGSSVTFFETYSNKTHIKWREDDGKWVEVERTNITLLKIPCIYIYRPKPIYWGLSILRDELEYTLSRQSDVVAYNSAPILKVTGEIMNDDENKGASRRLFRMEEGGDVSYVSWSQSTEAVKSHIDQLLKLFWMQGQMPDVSFEKLAGLGQVGYDARRLLFTDAHLKVGDEKGSVVEFLEREGNVIKAFLKEIRTDWADKIDEIDIEHVITPFIQDDEQLEINKCVAANGGKPIMSQRESIMKFGRSHDVDRTMQEIREEQAASLAMAAQTNTEE